MTNYSEEPPRPPGWKFEIDGVGNHEIDTATMLRLKAIQSAARTMAAHQRAMHELVTNLESGIQEALDDGLTIEQIADHADLRLSALKAYAEGTQPLFPKELLG